MVERDDRWQTAIDTPTASGTLQGEKIPVVELYHELGPRPENGTVTATIYVDELPHHSKVLVKSHVVAHGARALTSPQYLASIRRREAAKIAEQVGSLEECAGSEDFVIWTHKPLERLRQLVRKLTEAEEFCTPEYEGNSCEILRQLRDTFLNGGWERYREPAVRALAMDVLRSLATADEVSAGDADETMDRLFDADLDPSVGVMWQNDEEEISD